MSAAIVCPSCRSKAKGVGAVTLESLLTADALAGVGDANGYWHCAAPGCDVAYFEPASGAVVDKSGVTVRIGTKETSAPRPVCYCFGHSWESIEDDLRARGTTDVIETITEHCRRGEDRCPETNPQGSCCLGNVRRAVKEAKEKLAIVGDEAAESIEACCVVPPAEPLARAGGATGVVAAGAAVFTAVLSSTCCWLPLLLVALGAGTSTIAGALEAYRGWLLGGATVLLGAGFYFVYWRKEQCAPGDACEVPRPRLARFNKGMLWVATFLVAAFAFFPSYLSALLDDGTSSRGAGVVQTGTVERAYLVEGMTCEACTGHLREALGGVPGVASVAVSYADKRAVVAFEAGRVDDAAVLAAIRETGYTATVSEEE